MTPSTSTTNTTDTTGATDDGGDAGSLRLERVFHATPERLWDHWTDPQKYARWLNPGKADLKIQEYDVRVGGRVRFLMPLDDGQEMQEEGVFHVLEPHTRIVTGSPDKEFVLDVTFEPVDAARTRLVIVADGVPPGFHDAAREGWGRSLDKLQALVVSYGIPGISAPAAGSVKDRTVRMERWFNAEPARVFSAWSKPEMLERFFWPVGEGKVEKLDFRTGGELRMAHRTQPWTAIWEFLDIEDGRKITIRDIWPDGSGNETTGTMEFLPQDGGTLLKVVHGPFPTTGPYRPEDAMGGMSMVMDRLAEEVEVPKEGQGFRIVRFFDAAPEKVFRMWTTKEGLAKWWGTSAKAMGYEFRVATLDPRTGGTYDIIMSNEEHGELHNHGMYVDVQQDRRIEQLWDFDIFLGPEEKPYPIRIVIDFEPTPTMDGRTGTKLTFTQGPMARPDFTEGSRQGVIQNLRHLAVAVA